MDPKLAAFLNEATVFYLDEQAVEWTNARDFVAARGDKPTEGGE